MVRAVAVTPDGRTLLYASRDRLTTLKLESGEQIASFIGDSRFECMALSKDGSICVVGDTQGKLHFLRLENFR
jgi:hypothetical protein